MIRVRELEAFSASPSAIENYHTMLQIVNDPASQLRVDRNQKFYIADLSAGCLQIIVDIWNTVVQWIREGWNADKTLKDRLAEPMEIAVKGHFNEKMGRIIHQFFSHVYLPVPLDPEKQPPWVRIFGCDREDRSSIVKKSIERTASLAFFNQKKEEILALMQEIAPLRVRFPELNAVFDAVDLDLARLKDTAVSALASLDEFRRMATPAELTDLFRTAFKGAQAECREV
jgi:hypothetical protein